MRKNVVLLFVCILLVIFSSCASQNTEQHEDEIEVLQTPRKEKESYEPVSCSADALQLESLSYLGAFLLPDDGSTEKEMFSYGGEALCYNPQNDSLFIAGHNWYTYIAEISIPQPKLSKDTASLNQAEIIRDFTDIKGNLFNKWTMEIPRVGLEVVDDKLYFCFGEHYEEDTQLGTHGYTDLDLAVGEKVCVVGDYLYSTNDYMFKIPDKYKKFFGGHDLLTGRFRDGGWSGMGPSLFAIYCEDIVNAKNNEPISASVVIKYEDSYNGDDGHGMNDYSHADSWTGGALVSCDSGDAIIFIGTHSFGNTWYGFSNGVVYPVDGDEDAVYPKVPEYPHDERGWWSDDFRACIALYDANTAVKVFNEEIEPCEIQPYAFMDLSEYMIARRDETAMQYLGGAAYDETNNRLYVLELYADEDKPVVHVFTFE